MEAEPNASPEPQLLCPIHPTQEIVRVSLTDFSRKNIYCVQCIVDDKVSSRAGTNSTGDTLLKLDTFLELYSRIGSELSKLGSRSHSPSKKPLIDLEKNDEVLIKLSKHIQEEKEKVEAITNRLITTFTFLCEQRKIQLFEALDNQVFILQKNLVACKTKMDAYFTSVKDKAASSPLSHSHSHSLSPSPYFLNDNGTTNNNTGSNRNSASKKKKNITIDSTTELLKMIAELKEKIHEYDLLHNTFNDNFDKMTPLFDKYQAEVHSQLQTFPSSSISDPQKCDKTTKELHRLFTSFLDKSFRLKHSYYPIYLHPNFTKSKIFENADQLQLIETWIGHPIQCLSLLYQGSRDGFTAKAFHHKCDNVAPTLVLIRADTKRIFGGYTDQCWNSDPKYKTSNNSMVFSLSNKEKYSIINKSYAVCGFWSYGPTFGGGHDIYIGDRCNQMLNKSYLMTYNSKGLEESKRGLALAGSQYFLVEEIEVYQVL